MVVDHDQLGADSVSREIESIRYPNRCIAPMVMQIDTIGVDWSDSHPLNIFSTMKAAFLALFGD